MTQQETYSDSARIAYDAFAPVYDQFNAGNDYEVWLGQFLLPELEKHGLTQPGVALDVGCGTGRAFEPLLRRGWSLWGIDGSAEMLRRADEKLPSPYGYRGTVELAQCDARDLRPFVEASRHGVPHAIEFDLIFALNDIVNYLTEDGDLELMFAGMERNLGADGLVLFDANSLGLMRNNFAGAGMDRGEWTWRGDADEVEPGETYEAIVSGPEMEANVHRQRYWTDEEIRGALEAAGLECLAYLGHFEDPESWAITLHETPDDERDLKRIYIGGHRGE